MSFVKYPPTNIAEAIDVIEQDSEILHNIVHGDENTEVLTKNGLVPSVDKVLNDINTQADNVLAGIQADTDNVLNNFQADAAAAIANTGWFVAGDFATGFTFTAANQVGRDASGEFWSYNGALPFTVTAGTVPSAPTYTQRGDAALRTALAAPDSTVLVGGVEAGEIGKQINVSAVKESSIIHASSFGIVSDGTDQSPKLEAALATGKTIDITGVGLIKISSEIIANSGLKIICFDDVSGITGYDGLGFRVTGGDIVLEGLGVFGFYDGTDQNKTNYATAFCRVNAGAQLGKVVMNKVRANNNRSIIIAGSEADDFNPDVTIKAALIKVAGCDIRNTAMPVNWRALCDRDICVGNEYRNIIGAGRIVAAHKVYLDGLSNDSGFYEQCKNHLFAHNYVDGVVNRTTTGTSASGNNYECHALMVSGVNLHVHDNVIVDCTGNRFDTEAIYLKCKNFNIHDNTIINGGSGEGAICIKGVNSDVGVQAGPVGDNGRCVNNIIAYTRYSYDNGGVVVDLSSILTGIYVGVPNFVEVCDNKIYGSNLSDIILDGYPNSKNESVHVLKNKSYGFKGNVSILWRGAFRDNKSNGNEVINPEIGSSLGSFYHTYFVSVSGRGISRTNAEILDNKMVADVSDGRFNSKIVSLSGFDLEHYDFNGIKTGGNTFELSVGSATPNIRIYYVTEQTVNVSGTIYGLVAKPDTIKTTLKTSPWFWGNNRVNDYDITVEVANIVVNEILINAQFPTVTGKVLSVEAKTDFSFNANGETGTRWRIGTYFNNAGAASIQNQAEIYSYRAATAGEQILDANGVFGRVRLTNNTANPMKAKTFVRAVCI